jgi:hypothetical protein
MKLLARNSFRFTRPPHVGADGVPALHSRNRARQLMWTYGSTLGSFAALARNFARRRQRQMRVLQRRLISVVLIVALLFAVCAVRPQPAHANSDATTIAIILGGVIGGLMVIALIFTFFVRNNPAWMPAAPTAEANLRGNPWDRPVQRFRFGLSCATRDGALPLLCW